MKRLMQILNQTIVNLKKLKEKAKTINCIVLVLLIASCNAPQTKPDQTNFKKDSSAISFQIEKVVFDYVIEKRDYCREPNIYLDILIGNNSDEKLKLNIIKYSPCDLTFDSANLRLIAFKDDFINRSIIDVWGFADNSFADIPLALPYNENGSVIDPGGHLLVRCKLVHEFWGNSFAETIELYQDDLTQGTLKLYGKNFIEGINFLTTLENVNDIEYYLDDKLVRPDDSLEMNKKFIDPEKTEFYDVDSIYRLFE